MLNQIIPVVPVLIVALSACAVLLAESFRRQGDWMPVGWLGIIGLTGRFVAMLIGVVFIVVGLLISLTIVGAIVGIPLALFGLLLVVRGLA